MTALACVAAALWRFRNDAPPAIIENCGKRMAAIDKELQPLFTENLKDGLPTKEAMDRIEALQTEAKQVAAVQAAAKQSFELSQIPEEERFNAAFGNEAASLAKGFERFSLSSAIKGNVEGRAPEGIVREMSQEAAKELHACGASASLDGLALPRTLVQYLASRTARIRAATQSVTGTNLGSQLVPTELRSDLLQTTSLLPTPIVERIGAFVLRGLTGNISIPTIAPTGAVTTKTENADATAVDHATGSKSMQPRRLPAYVDISDQLVMQSSPDVEALILSLILERLAVTKDVYSLNGTGTHPEPPGLLGTSGIGSVAGGTNGLAPTWSNIVDLETAVSDANANGNVYLTNSAVRGKLKKTQYVASSSTAFIWGNDNLLNGYRTAVSNVVPRDLTKGTSSGVCSAIIFGDFAKLLVGYWGGMMIERPQDKANAIAGKRTIVVTEFFDSVVLQPASFAAMKDALTT